jgi:iron complex outermembrane recepter protein
MKLFISIVICICLCTKISAQTTGKISGRINNEAGKPLAGVTVLLYHLPDSVLAKTALSITDGSYEIDLVQPADYYLAFTHTGFAQKTTSKISVQSGENFSVPASSIAVLQKELGNVVVTGTYKKPLIEVTADKTIFNVESSINATGSNAFELLQKSPGVVTDKDDNISLKGKNGVRVYIDGRQVQMDAGDLAAYLKSINSADIEAIEMITNPSAKYDAAGNAGIINIRFKKNKKLGFNGNASAGYAVGINPKTNAGLSFNYRNKGLNFYSNYSNNWAINKINFNLYRKQGDSLYDQKTVSLINGWTHNLKAGLDFFVAKTQTIGVIVTANFNDNTTTSNTTTPISSLSTGKLGQYLYASNTLPQQVSNINYNLNYRYADTVGNEFNIDADLGKYKNRRSSYQPNYYYSPYPSVLQGQKIYSNSTPIDINIFTFKMDYEKSIGINKLGIGVKLSNVNTNNIFNFFDVLDGYQLMDLARSNTFDYKENVRAGYINYNTALGSRWKIQAGVRAENTSSKGSLTRADGAIQADNIVERNYTDLFPSAAVTYTVNENNMLNLSYSRRIDRPSYQDLNPFENKIDELTYQKGNAFLLPQYTNSVQLSYTFMGRYTASLGYSHVSQFSAFLIDTVEQKRTFLTRQNLAVQNITNLNLSLPFQITKWWSMYNNINIFNSIYKANLGPGKIIDINIFSGSLYAQNSFTLGDGYTAELSGFYNAPSVWAGTFRSRAMGSVDIGLQKQLFKNKATIKFSYTDLLNTFRWKGESNYSGANIVTSGNWESRQLRMNFTYRFGNSQVKQARQRNVGSDDEKKRTESTGGLGGN